VVLTAEKDSITNIKSKLPKQWCDLLDEYTVVNSEIVRFGTKQLTVSVCKGMAVLLFDKQYGLQGSLITEEFNFIKAFSYNHYIQNGIELHGQTTITPEQLLYVVEALNEAE
jgi:hypothetical protein